MSFQTKPLYDSRRVRNTGWMDGPTSCGSQGKFPSRKRRLPDWCDKGCCLHKPWLNWSRKGWCYPSPIHTRSNAESHPLPPHMQTTGTSVKYLLRAITKKNFDSTVRCVPATLILPDQRLYWNQEWWYGFSLPIYPISLFMLDQNVTQSVSSAYHQWGMEIYIYTPRILC